MIELKFNLSRKKKKKKKKKEKSNKTQQGIMLKKVPQNNTYIYRPSIQRHLVASFTHPYNN